jgi:hypothetical protein
MAQIDYLVEDFRSRLPSTNAGEFNEQFNEELNGIDRGEIEDELRVQYEKAEDHLELVVAVASAFHQVPLAGGYDTGYEFAFTEPLEEFNSEVMGDEGVKNGDVLLVKKESDHLHFCIVECKAETDPIEIEWLNELMEIRETLEEDGYLEYLKYQAGVEDYEVRDVQYALLGKSIPVHSSRIDGDWLQEHADSPSKYAFWGYDLRDQAMTHINGEIRDSDLAREMKSVLDAGKVENPIEFTFSDHPLTQIKRVLERMITQNKRNDDEHPLEFNRDDFREVFNRELQVGFSDEIREELVDNKVDSLLKVCQESEIVVTDSGVNSSREYRIYFRGNTAEAAKRKAEEKYFQEISRQKQKERAFEEVRNDFPVQSRIDEYDFE